MFVLSQKPCFPLGAFVKLSQTKKLFLGGFAKLSQAIVSPRGFRETVTDQKTFPFVGFAKLSRAKSSRRAKAFFPLGGFVKLSRTKTHFLFPLGGIVKLSSVLTRTPRQSFIVIRFPQNGDLPTRFQGRIVEAGRGRGREFASASGLASYSEIRYLIFTI